MSLAKIPVIILLTWGFKVMLTPPHPPPAEDESVPTTTIDLKSIRYHRLAAARIIQIIVAGLETSTILAVSSSSNISQRILSTSVFQGGRPENLRLVPLSALGAAALIFGAALRANTYQVLGRFFHYEISIQKNHELIVTGPYSVVRHPSYSGLLIANIGWLLWNYSRGSWVRESGLLETKAGKILVVAYALFFILPTSMITLSRMGREDEALKKKFGKKWDEWAERVPYSVIPGVY